MGVDDTARLRRLADLLTVTVVAVLQSPQWVVILGCSFAGVCLLVGLPWALIAVAVLTFFDLLSDLWVEALRGRAGRTTRG